ncbi:MAG TPA: general secretion pathway protein GspB [Steroidobacteraceae bacterium]|nr:general secretion pathway protein GspB [Steroidobacteraceae bacterium]
MSFILDALKKSESDRQRQTGPALFEVKVAPPRTRLPPWAIAIAALLVVNLGIVMWMVLRHAGATTPAAASAGPGSAAAPPASAAPPTVTAQPASAPAAPMPSATVPSATVPSATVAAGPGPATQSATPAAASTTGASAGNADSNPDDYAPAQEAAPAAAGSSFGGHVRRGTAAGVPLYQDAAATAGAQLPQLRLDLHVYAQRPQDRFVMINMHKLREGDALPEGVKVENITPEGAVLSFNGSRFLLPRE